MTDDTPSININGKSHSILCGFCKQPVVHRGELDTESSEIGCIPCDSFLKSQQAAQIAIEYAKNEAQLILNRHARDVARKSKVMTFKGDTAHNQTYRFIVEF